MEPSFHHMNKNKQMCTHTRTHTGTNSTATVCCQSLSAESTELRTSIPCDCLQHVLLLAPLWPCLKGSPAGKDCFCLQWDCRDYNMCASEREGVCMRPLRLAFDGSKACDTHSPSLLFCLSFFTLFSVSFPSLSQRLHLHLCSSVAPPCCRNSQLHKGWWAAVCIILFNSLHYFTDAFHQNYDASLLRNWLQILSKQLWLILTQLFWIFVEQPTCLPLYCESHHLQCEVCM